jgi:hypothetical protein
MNLVTIIRITTFSNTSVLKKSVSSPIDNSTKKLREQGTDHLSTIIPRSLIQSGGRHRILLSISVPFCLVTSTLSTQ